MPLDTFDSAFITAHEAAFDELVALGSAIAQKSVDGEQAPDKYVKGLKLQTILKARRNEDLTDKEAEALDGCLSLLTEAAYVPSVSLLVDLQGGYSLNEDGGFTLNEDGGILLLE